MHSDPSPPVSVTPEALIGQVTLRWNMIEMLVKELLVRLISPDRTVGQILTWDENWSWLRERLKLVGSHRISQYPDELGAEELLADLTAVMSFLEECNKDRNLLAHGHTGMYGGGLFGEDPNKVTIQTIRLKGRRQEPGVVQEEWDEKRIDKSLNGLSKGFVALTRVTEKFRSVGIAVPVRSTSGLALGRARNADYRTIGDVLDS